MVKRFLRSRRTGFYLSVAREGEIAAGDALYLLSRDEHSVSIADITRLYGFDRSDTEGMRYAASVTALPESWRAYFAERAARNRQ
jgi:MOSC domain-containing protein YiiM